MFDDDWDASTFLYPRDDDTTSSSSSSSSTSSRPPITLLVVAIGDNVIFDPAKEELAVAETALAVSVAEVKTKSKGKGDNDMEVEGAGRSLRLLSMRTVDPPSRLTPPGVAHSANTVAGNVQQQDQQTQTATEQQGPVEGVWKAPLGGTKFGVLDAIIQAVLEKGGVADEVLDGLEGVELA